MERNIDLRYGGVSTSPSDYGCQDGELSECVNLHDNGGEIASEAMPEAEESPELGERDKMLLGWHTTADYRHEVQYDRTAKRVYFPVKTDFVEQWESITEHSVEGEVIGRRYSKSKYSSFTQQSLNEAIEFPTASESFDNNQASWVFDSNYQGTDTFYINWDGAEKSTNFAYFIYNRSGRDIHIVLRYWSEYYQTYMVKHMNSTTYEEEPEQEGDEPVTHTEWDSGAVHEIVISNGAIIAASESPSQDEFTYFHGNSPVTETVYYFYSGYHSYVDEINHIRFAMTYGVVNDVDWGTITDFSQSVALFDAGGTWKASVLPQDFVAMARSGAVTIITDDDTITISSGGYYIKDSQHQYIPQITGGSRWGKDVITDMEDEEHYDRYVLWDGSVRGPGVCSYRNSLDHAVTVKVVSETETLYKELAAGEFRFFRIKGSGDIIDAAEPFGIENIEVMSMDSSGEYLDCSEYGEYLHMHGFGNQLSLVFEHKNETLYYDKTRNVYKRVNYIEDFPGIEVRFGGVVVYRGDRLGIVADTHISRAIDDAIFHEYAEHIENRGYKYEPDKLPNENKTIGLAIDYQNPMSGGSFKTDVSYFLTVFETTLNNAIDSCNKDKAFYTPIWVCATLKMFDGTEQVIYQPTLISLERLMPQLNNTYPWDKTIEVTMEGMDKSQSRYVNIENAQGYIAGAKLQYKTMDSSRLKQFTSYYKDLVDSVNVYISLPHSYLTTYSELWGKQEKGKSYSISYGGNDGGTWRNYNATILTSGGFIPVVVNPRKYILENFKESNYNTYYAKEDTPRGTVRILPPFVQDMEDWYDELLNPEAFFRVANLSLNKTKNISETYTDIEFGINDTKGDTIATQPKLTTNIALSDQFANIVNSYKYNSRLINLPSQKLSKIFAAIGELRATQGWQVPYDRQIVRYYGLSSNGLALLAQQTILPDTIYKWVYDRKSVIATGASITTIIKRTTSIYSSEQTHDMYQIRATEKMKYFPDIATVEETEVVGTGISMPVAVYYRQYTTNEALVFVGKYYTSLFKPELGVKTEGVESITVYSEDASTYFTGEIGGVKFVNGQLDYEIKEGGYMTEAIDQNTIYMSELSNPAAFKSEGVITVGDGKVLALATNTLPVSEGQFGEYPLYAFCTDGIYMLGIGSTGYITQVKPIARYCLNDKMQVQECDDFVAFVGTNGVNIVQGREVACISEQLKLPIFDLKSKLPGIAEIFAKMQVNGHTNAMDMFGEIGGEATYQQIFERSRMAWDGKNRRLIFYNDTDRIAHVWRPDTKAWNSMLLDTPVIHSFQDYPHTYMQGTDYVLWQADVDKNTATEVMTEGFLLTRPVSFGDKQVLKSLRRLINRGSWQNAMKKGSRDYDSSTSYVRIALFGSRDGDTWFRMTSTRGVSFKFFRIALFAKFLPKDALTGTSVVIDARETDKMR
jgi:hypothetical protein